MAGLEIDLSGRVALVTGGGAGIGRGIALALAAGGADVVLAEIDPDRADATANDIRALGREALHVPTDALDTGQVRAAVAAADERFGRLDILVNNAGGVRGRLFLDQSERSWRRHLDINLVSMMAATAAAAPIMIRDGRGGSIVNVASIEAGRAAPTFAVYAAAKAGMVSFTRTMAVELSEHQIRVNCIAPDMTVTPGNHGQFSGPVDPATYLQQPPEVQAALERYIPLGREGVIEECGSVVAFLCSTLASYVTGVVLPVDGGTAAASGWVRSGTRHGWDLGGAAVAGTGH